MEPLATINWTVLCLLVFGFAWGIVATLFGRDSIFGWGRYASVCADGPGIGTDIHSTQSLRLHAGVSQGSNAIRLCADKPTAGQRWWYSIEQFPGSITLFAVVVTTFLVLRHADRFGLYSPGIATRLRVLGWYLVIESVVGPAIRTYASHTLWSTMADVGGSEIQWLPEWTALFAGLALLSLARIMRVGTAMREDLEGVV